MRTERIPGVLRTALLGLLLLGTAPLAAAPQIEEWRTGNGARVLFIAANALPMVDVQVVFDAGSARDGTRHGLALLTNGLLAEGAGDLDADAIAATFEGLGARFGNDSQRDMATVTLRSLTDRALLDPAVDLLATLLARPTFAAADLERERQRMLVGLQGEQQSPGELAAKAFYRAVFGDHPYAAPVNGTPESLAALTREDLAVFHARHYVAANAVVAIVGDLDRTAAEALAERVVGALPAGEAAPALPPVAPLDGPRRVHVEHPSAQTHVLVGQPGMRRGDPDYFALYLANHSLGGSGLVSRLGDVIREERGLAYSVSSYFIPMRGLGPFRMALQTREDQAGEALALLDAELRSFVADGVDADAFAFSQQSVSGGFPMRIDSNRKLVGYLGMIGFYGLPLDYLERFNERVEGVTLEQARDAFRRRVDPDRLVTVTVGPSDPTGG